MGLARVGHAWVAPVSLPRQSLLWLFSAGNVDVSPPVIFRWSSGAKRAFWKRNVNI